MNKFWLVWCSIFGHPYVRHETQEAAKKEASRLAIKNPGNTFIVLESLGQYHQDATLWTPHN